jgi:(p)ppGpp synthase/HD superfamily hydrolase
MDRYTKLRISMRYRLLGAASADKRFQVALDALDFAEKKYTGKVRKDGVTPSFMHPLEIMAYLTTLLPSLRHPAETLAAAAIHDVVEDDGVSVEECRDRFGPRVGHATMRVSKVIHGVPVPSIAEHFELMLDCPIATVLKPTDRVNNQGTMGGVFSREKQLAYVDESERLIIPMMKKARHIYSDQEAAFENLKLSLRNQIALVRAMHQAGDTA